MNQHATPQAQTQHTMRLISTLSSVHTTNSTLSDHHTKTLTNEQSPENSSKGHEKFTKKMAQIRKR